MCVIFTGKDANGRTLLEALEQWSKEDKDWAKAELLKKYLLSLTVTGDGKPN